MGDKAETCLLEGKYTRKKGEVYQGKLEICPGNRMTKEKKQFGWKHPHKLTGEGAHYATKQGAEYRMFYTTGGGREG